MHAERVTASDTLSALNVWLVLTESHWFSSGGGDIGSFSRAADFVSGSKPLGWPSTPEMSGYE